MKTLQYIGPFKENQTIRVLADYDRQYVHIGIQIPQRQPIDKAKGRELEPDLSFGVNSSTAQEYRINDHGILEFDELAYIGYVIKFLKDLPKETIIDIAYSDLG